MLLVLGLLDRAAARTGIGVSGGTIGEEKVRAVSEARDTRGATNRIGRAFGSGMNFGSHGNGRINSAIVKERYVSARKIVKHG